MADMLPRLFFTHFRSTSFVAARGSVVVGFLCGFVSATDPQTAYVHFVGIDPVERGSGIGRGLYLRFFDVARAQGCTSVACVTSPVNELSMQFHRALGFEGDLVIDYDGRGNDRVLFSKSIELPHDGPMPREAVRAARAAHTTLLGDLTCRDLDPRAPTLLPGWSNGHLITHLARNADSLTGIFRAAAAGRVGQQYPGGFEQRAGDIESGASRSLPELLHDLGRACAELEAAWAATTDDVWASGAGNSMFGELPLKVWPSRRWREVEIHHVDFGLGFTHDDWSTRFVARDWTSMVAGLTDRIGDGGGLTLVPTVGEPELVAGGGVEVRGTRRELLAWMLDRHKIPGAPPLAPWG